MLENVFAKFGLEAIHTRIYLNLLESGPISAGNLTKRLNLPRSSLYGFLDDLRGRGLVTQSERYAVKIWQAAPPEKMNQLVDEQMNGLENIKTTLAGILPDIIKRQKTDFINPKFSYFEGSEEIRHMLKDLLLHRDIATEAFWPYKDMAEIINEDFIRENNHIQRIKRNIYIRVIWPENKTVDIDKYPFLGVGKKFLKEIRIAPPQVDCSMGYWAYANKVMFISSKVESFGFIVESVELRQLLKTQFDIIWNLSRPVPNTTTKKSEEFINSLKISNF